MRGTSTNSGSISIGTGTLDIYATLSNTGSLTATDSLVRLFGSFDTAPLEINDDYDKEVTDSFEIGLKTDLLDNRLRINVAAFETRHDTPAAKLDRLITRAESMVDMIAAMAAPR